MPHNVSLIALLASGFGLALVLGLAAARLRMPPLVGYLLAGVVIGPGTPGFVADVELSGQLAEIGVMLLMFGVGLHFSLADLLAVRRIAVPGAVVQIAAATLLGGAVALGWGWPIGDAMVFGLSLSVASTVVLLRALEARGHLKSTNGRIAVGWLVVEDLAMVLVLAFRYPLNTALTVGASLAQIGEFSFILAGLGVSLGLLTPEGQSLILAGALISIALNSLLFTAIEPAQAWARAHSAWARRLDLRDDPLAALPMSTDRKLLTGQVVLVGYGQVGQHIAAALAERHIPCIVADSNREVVEKLRAAGRAAVSGDASDPIVLVQAHITRAAMLVVTTPDTLASRQMVDIARKLNPDIEIVLRIDTEDGAALLRGEKLGEVFVGEEELARGMCSYVTKRMLRPAPTGA